MTSDFGNTRYCKRCGQEIVKRGEVVTWYSGKKVCKCDKIDIDYEDISK